MTFTSIKNFKGEKAGIRCVFLAGGVNVFRLTAVRRKDLLERHRFVRDFQKELDNQAVGGAGSRLSTTLAEASSSLSPRDKRI